MKPGPPPGEGRRGPVPVAHAASADRQRQGVAATSSLLPEVAIAMARVLLSLLTALPAAAAVPESFVSPATQEAAAPADARARAARLGADASTPSLEVGSSDPAVLRAQILLNRAWFSPGEIDGRFSANMRRAVAAFQKARDLPVSGRLDDATWAALSRRWRAAVRRPHPDRRRGRRSVSQAAAAASPSAAASMRSATSRCRRRSPSAST